MPYIVTTKRTVPTDLGRDEVADAGVLSRRAVATLEEAQDLVREAGATVTAAVITESGGTITLPDGTEIEVEQRQWCQLAEAVGWDFHGDAHRSEAELLDAYNARQA
jgi:hypothetical protein